MMIHKIQNHFLIKPKLQVASHHLQCFLLFSEFKNVGIVAPIEFNADKKWLYKPKSSSAIFTFDPFDSPLKISAVGAKNDIFIEQ